MKKEEIKKILKDLMVTDIQSVVSGEKKVVYLLGVSPSEVKMHLESLGFKCKDIETNGWEWDFYFKAFLNDKKYIVSGSGYYSDSVTFEFDEDE